MAKTKKTVIINKKMYKMPDWNFRNIRKLEENGLDLMKIQSPQKNIFTSLAAFIAVAAGVEIEDADALIEAHIDGGGDIRELLNDFYGALGTSPFFSRMVENMTKETKKETNPENRENEAESENA